MGAEHIISDQLLFDNDFTSEISIHFDPDLDPKTETQPDLHLTTM